ncbi:MAG: hypothetical protein J7K11_04775 [Candidatus Hydrothermae bacterium]|nr:hypothetical protein [Candidatus Hydrothermae bacterium]
MRITIAFLLMLGNLGAMLFSDINTSPQALGRSGAFVASAEGLEAVHFNPAGLTEISNFEVQTYYKHLYSGLSVGLHNASIAVAKRWKNSVIAFNFQDFGASLKGEYEGRYAEDVLTVTYGYSLSKYLRFGTNFSFYHLQEPRFGGTSSFGVDLGIITSIYKSWQMGVFVQNLNAPSIHGDYDNYRLPRFIAFGMSLKPMRNATTEIAVRKEENYPARFMIGQELSLFRGMIGLRGGLLSEGELTKFSFGLDFNKAPLKITYGMQYDPNLPLTHIIGVSYGR